VDIRQTQMTPMGETPLQFATALKPPARTSSALFVLLALVSIAGCSDPLVTETQIGGIPQTTLLIRGDLGPQHQDLRLHLGSTRITDAIVTVNGFAIPHRGAGTYIGDLPQAVPEGGTLNLKVVAGKMKFEGSGIVLPTPTITAPTAGRIFVPTDAITVAWSSPTDPDGFRICLNCWDSFYGDNYEVSGSSREFKISLNNMLLDDGAPVTVSAVKGDFLKPASSPDILLQVGFVATSRGAIINIKY
jgi:hypothetical protein